MKIITQKLTNLVLYVFEDSKVIEITDANIIVGQPIEFTISDCSSQNTMLFLNVEVPDDWIPNKYLFEENQFTLNPKWTELSPVTK